MDLRLCTPIILSNLSNLSVFVLEQNPEKLSRCMQQFAKNKEHVQIVTNERSLSFYDKGLQVQTTYQPDTYDYHRGAAYLFDDCLTDDWRKDPKLVDFISYPRMYGLTTVFGFRCLPDLPSRMYWNLDLICIGVTDDRDKIYDAWFMYRMSYDTFCDLVDTYTNEDGFLVLRREGTEDRIYRTVKSKNTYTLLTVGFP